MESSDEVMKEFLFSSVHQCSVVKDAVYCGETIQQCC